MTPAEIIMIAQLISILEPAAASLLAQIIAAFKDSGMDATQRQATLEKLAATLEPMKVKA